MAASQPKSVEDINSPNFAIRSGKKAPAKEEEKTREEKIGEFAHQLPEPCGYKLLVALPEASEKTEGGLYKAEATRKLEEVGTVIGFVMKLGPDAYADKEKFPNGPYCQERDWIIMRSYAGTRITVHGKEFRLLNDDSVEAVVQDPRGIEKK